MTAKPIGIVLSSRRDRRRTLQALALGRIWGRRAADQELVKPRAEIVRLTTKLERAERRYEFAESIIDRSDSL
jgi:hypothetical protein